MNQYKECSTKDFLVIKYGIILYKYNRTWQRSGGSGGVDRGKNYNGGDDDGEKMKREGKTERRESTGTANNHFIILLFKLLRGYKE